MSSLARIDANRRNAARSTGPRTQAGKAIVARNATTHGVFAAVPVLPGESAAEWDAHRAGVVASHAPVGLLEVTFAERAALVLWRLHRLARYEAESTAARIAAHDLPPVPTVAESLSVFRPPDRATQLRDLRRDRRATADELDRVGPARDLVAGLGSDTPGPVPADLAWVVFRAAYDLVVADGQRATDPPELGSKGFRRRLELPAAPEPIAWTTDVVRRGLGVFAACLPVPPAAFIRDVVEALDERAEDLARTAARLDREMAAVEHHLAAGNTAKQTDELLPGDGRDDRIAKYERHLHAMLTSTLHELERLQARRGGGVLPPPAVADLTVTVVARPE